jgi:hypothetical protein
MPPESPTSAETAEPETNYIAELDPDSYEYRVAMCMLELLAESDQADGSLDVIGLLGESGRRVGLGVAENKRVLDALTTEGYLDYGPYTAADLLDEGFREGRKNMTRRVLTEKGEDFFTSPR